MRRACRLVTGLATAAAIEDEDAPPVPQRSVTCTMAGVLRVAATWLFAVVLPRCHGQDDSHDVVLENGVTPYVEVVSSGIIEGASGPGSFTTFRLSLVVAEDPGVTDSAVGSCYTIYGDSGRGSGSHPLIMPPAWQAGAPFGSNVGGVDPAFVSIDPSAGRDSWVTLGMDDGTTAWSGSIDVNFDAWNLSHGLSVDDGGIFYMDPPTAPALSPGQHFLIAQLTLRDCRGPQTAMLSAQGKTVLGMSEMDDNQNRHGKTDWRQYDIIFNMDTCGDSTSCADPSNPNSDHSLCTVTPPAPPSSDGGTSCARRAGEAALLCCPCESLAPSNCPTDVAGDGLFNDEDFGVLVFNCKANPKFPTCDASQCASALAAADSACVDYPNQPVIGRTPYTDFRNTIGCPVTTPEPAPEPTPEPTPIHPSPSPGGSTNQLTPGVTCDDYGSMNDLIGIINAKCCNDPGEECTNGLPMTCDAECAAVLRPFRSVCDEFLTSPMNSGIRDAVDAAIALCAPVATCNDYASFNQLLDPLNDKCCNDPGESCSQGIPTTCDAECAAVLLPMAQACSSFLQSSMNQGIWDAIELATAMCSTIGPGSVGHR